LAIETPERKTPPNLRGRLGAFVVCVLLHMGLPLAPLGVELLATGSLSEKSLSIGATMYAASIGVSSRWKVTLAAVLFAIVCFAPMYGIALTHSDVVAPELKNGQNVYIEDLVHHALHRYSMYLIIGVFLLHLIERFNRHVLRNEPFWNFD
jgi:hypothetical protein